MKILFIGDIFAKGGRKAVEKFLPDILEEHDDIELVIANNDDMALGAISALQGAGYNKQGGKTIPVFGVDATEAAKSAIANGSMMGTIKQDAEGMADVIVKITQNLKDGKDKFNGINSENVLGSWRVNIPYAEYTAQNQAQ